MIPIEKKPEPALDNFEQQEKIIIPPSEEMERLAIEETTLHDRVIVTSFV